MGKKPLGLCSKKNQSDGNALVDGQGGGRSGGLVYNGKVGNVPDDAGLGQGGYQELREGGGPLIDKNAADAEDPQKFKKNAWAICGKVLPAWMAPRNRNKQ